MRTVEQLLAKVKFPNGEKDELSWNDFLELATDDEIGVLFVALIKQNIHFIYTGQGLEGTINRYGTDVSEEMLETREQSQTAAILNEDSILKPKYAKFKRFLVEVLAHFQEQKNLKGISRIAMKHRCVSISKDKFYLLGLHNMKPEEITDAIAIEIRNQI